MIFYAFAAELGVWAARLAFTGFCILLWCGGEREEEVIPNSWWFE